MLSDHRRLITDHPKIRIQCKEQHAQLVKSGDIRR